MSATSSRSLLWVVVLAVLAAAAAGANWFFVFRDGDRGHRAGDATTTTAMAAEERIVCFGHVDVEYGVRSLYPVQPGRVSAVLVHESQHVAEGVELLRLDDRAARFTVREAEADLRAAQAQQAQAEVGRAQHQARVGQQQAALEAARERLAAAKQGLLRKRSLFKIQQVSTEEVAVAEHLVEELEAGLRAEQEKLRELSHVNPELAVTRAQADVAVRQARIDQARHALDECSLRAPTAGEILRVLVGPGDVLGAQPRPAILFCPEGPRFVRAEVSQEFADRLHVGQAALIQNDTITSLQWQGRVQRVSNWYTQRRSVIQEPLQVNDVRTLECIVEVKEGTTPLRIGQRVRVTIGAAGE